MGNFFCRAINCPKEKECLRFTSYMDKSATDFSNECQGVEGFPYFWPKGKKNDGKTHR